jgi:glycosyltransferase involved in cell wall biosynthesis
MTPYFSIIIAYYNQSKLIGETLQSISDQEYNNYEIVIINDGSSEAETEFIKGLAEANDKVVLITQNNTGPGSARNRGIDKSTGEYIIFLDGDDLLSEGALSKFHSFLKKEIKTDILISDCIYFGGRNNVRKQKAPSFPQLLAYNTVVISAVIKRSFLGDLRFDPFFDRIGLEDWELWIRMVEKKGLILHLGETLFKIRVDASSRTYQTANKNLNEAVVEVYRKHAVLIQKEMGELVNENKQLKESLNTRIGDLVLTPYRLIKKIIS